MHRAKPRLEQMLLRQVSMDNMFPEGMCACTEESELAFSALLYVSQIVTEKGGMVLN